MEAKNDKAIEAAVTENAEVTATENKKKRGRRPKTKVAPTPDTTVGEAADEKIAEVSTTAEAQTDDSAANETATDVKADKAAADADIGTVATNVSADESAHTEMVDEDAIPEKANTDVENTETESMATAEQIENKFDELLSEIPKRFEEQSLDEMLFSALAKDEPKKDDAENADVSAQGSNDVSETPLSEDETTAAKLRNMIEDQLEAADIVENDEDTGWDEEFLDIPESFSEDDSASDDVQLSDEDEASSIAALLYDDNEVTITQSYDTGAPVSFSQLRIEMQKIRDDARELRGETDEPEEAEEETTAEEIEGQITLDEELSEIMADVSDPQQTEEVEENDDLEENGETEGPMDAQKQQTSAKKEDKPLRVTPIMADDVRNPKEQQKEHIITIDRGRIKEDVTPKDRLIDGVFEVVEMFVFTLLIIMALTTFVFRHSVVEGSSMENTLFNGDHLIISDLFYEPERGDIVVCEDHSTSVKGPIVKRIIALGGDTVRIENSMIYVNGEFVYEGDYVYDVDLSQNMEEFVVPEGEIFVMGDHRRVSFDSEEFGTIDEDAILGKVILRFFPFDKIQFFFD